MVVLCGIMLMYVPLLCVTEKRAKAPLSERIKGCHRPEILSSCAAQYLQLIVSPRPSSSYNKYPAWPVDPQRTWNPQHTCIHEIHQHTWNPPTCMKLKLKINLYLISMSQLLCGFITWKHLLCLYDVLTTMCIINSLRFIFRLDFRNPKW